MKRNFTVILCILLLLSGCSKDNSMQMPCNIYYLQREINNIGIESVIASQVIDGAGFSAEDLLSQYLSSVPEAGLVSPFPAGVRLHSFAQEDSTLQLTLSDELSSLTGIDLTLACMCLSKTCFELTHVETVEIRCQTEKLGSSESLVISKDSFRLADTFLPESAEPATTTP